MRQLSPLDAQLLLLESPTATGHVGALLLLDSASAPGGTLSLEDLAAVLEARLQLAPALRERVVEVPWGLDSPYWVEDPHFDLEYHVREVILPHPGDARQLAEVVARISARPLDRSRPLWEMYLVQGVDGRSAALYAKFHSAEIGDILAAEILAAILDADERPRDIDEPAAPWAPAPVPAPPALLAQGLVDAAVRSGRLLAQAAVSALTGEPAPHSDERHLPVPPTPFNGPITAHRRFAYGRVDLADVRTVANAYGVGPADVVMAMVATALRRWLLDHDALPAIPLVTASPVSHRTDGGDDRTAEALNLVLVRLPTDEADPEARLYAVAAARVEAQAAPVVPARLVQDFSAVALPSELVSWAARALLPVATAPSPPFNLIVSDASGPPGPVYVAGAAVSAMHPMSTVTDATGGMNITLCGYAGHLDFGIVVCREMVPDVWRIAGYLSDALDELVALGDG